MGFAGEPEREAWFRRHLTRFLIVPSSADLSRKWAEVMVSARQAGRRVETADAWVAATALLYDAPLLTHNKSDYPGVPGLRFAEE